MRKLAIGFAVAAVAASFSLAAHATPMIATGSQLSLTGYANVDGATKTIKFYPGSLLNAFGETGSFSALGSGGSIVFEHQGNAISYLTLDSGSDLACGLGCIYVATASNGDVSTFDMTSETVTQTPTTLTIMGVGTASLTGFLPTPGVFELTTQLGSGSTNLSFSTTTTTVPEPSTMTVFAAGLLSLGLAARRRRV